MNETPVPDAVDGVLRDYFRSQLPRAWPPAPVIVRSESSWWRRSRLRLALATSVLAALAGYLTLAGHFPRTLPTQALELNGPNIANRPTHSSSPSAPR